MKNLTTTAMLLCLVFAGCSKREPVDRVEPVSETLGTTKSLADGGHGPNDGHYVALGSVALIEFVHDAEGGMAKLWVTGPDKMTPIFINEAPVLKLDGQEDQIAVKMNPMDGSGSEASHYACRHDALKAAKPDGRIIIKVKETTYVADLADTRHDH